ncbi:unnamed protein product [Prorocentrum cordatum]|uniref:Secreted protein n=1 Tax=Prorocentrum cordatum TaxID=2364126 RepID=A0ABN9PB61_9DINO|nr:unnamed protein product [Polarella glacialis]
MCTPISTTSVTSNLSVLLLALAQRALMGVCAAAEVPVVCGYKSVCGACVYFSRTDITYKDVYDAAWCLPPCATVTDAEVSAAERICDVLPQVVQNFFGHSLV